MSKTVSFFLASSIKDVEFDRLAVGDFINQMNMVYQPLDVFIRLYKCEDDCMDHSMIVGGTQKTLDDLIRESDLCFVLFWKKAGDVTKHELEVAFEAYQNNNKPKVVVYFKALPEGESLPKDIIAIMNVIDNEMLHYHREYSHIDSLKLGIIMQLSVHGFIHSDLKVENGDITAFGQRIASTSQIPLFAQNEEYLELVKQYKEADAECVELLSEYGLDKANAKVYRRYQKAIKKRQRISDDLEEITDGIIAIGRRIAAIASSSAISERIREAIKCFDGGDYEGVLDILHPDEIENQVQLLDAMENQLLMARCEVIEEYRLRILALEAKGKWDEVYETYERTIIQVEKSKDVPRAICIEYARFLAKQGKYSESAQVCERLKSFFEANPACMSPHQFAELLELLGSLYFDGMRYEDAETAFMQALEILQDIPDAELQLAQTKTRLAKVYFKVNRHFHAEALYTEALATFREHDKDGVQPVDTFIAEACLELGDLYYMINRHEDAGNLFMNAYEKYRLVVENGEYRYRESQAIACDKYARLTIAVFSHQKSDRYYVEAMQVKERLSKSEPQVYMEYYAQMLEKLGGLWSRHGTGAYAKSVLREAEATRSSLRAGAFSHLRKEECQTLDFSFYAKPIDKELLGRMCRESLGIYRDLADQNPEAYEPKLAQAQNTIATLFSQTGERGDAEKNYMEALSLRELLVRRNPMTMRPALAATMSNIGYHYYLWESYAEAEKYYLSAIDIYEDIATDADGAFVTDLARNYNSIANLYAKMGNREIAERYYHDSLMRYFALYKKSPRAYIDRIINTVANVVALLDGGDSSSWIAEFLS